MVDNVKDQLEVFRAEELARAALAKANYKSFLEKQKEKDKPQSEDFLDDLTMVVIDNEVRNNSATPAMGGGASENSDEPNVPDPSMVTK